LKEKEKECRLMDEKFQELEEMQRELMEENEALKEFVKLCHTRKEHVNKLKISQEEKQVNYFFGKLLNFPLETRREGKRRVRARFDRNEEKINRNG